MKVYRQEVFSLNLDSIRYAPYERKIWSSIDILSYLSRLIEPRVFGFSPSTMPDRRWIINIAFTLAPTLEIFTGGNQVDDIVGIPIEFIENNRFFDPYIKVSKKPIFMKTEETRMREQREKFQKRLMKKERRMNYLTQEANRIHSEISDIQAGIDTNSNR